MLLASCFSDYFPPPHVPSNSQSCTSCANRSTPPCPLHTFLHQMPRQQKIRNPLLHRVLVPAAPAHQLALLYARLQQQLVQISRRLTRLLVRWLLALCYFLDAAFDEVVWCGCCGWEVWEAELMGVSIGTWQSVGVGRDRGRTSLLMMRSSSHINRGRMFFKKGRLRLASTISSSESLGWRGKEEACVLQALIAQVRKLSVRSFMVACCG